MRSIFRVGASLAQMMLNSVRDRVHVFVQLVVPESQHQIALFTENGVAMRVLGDVPSVAMLAPIELDDKLRAMLHEIQEI